VDSPQPRETLTAEIKAEDELGFLDYVEISDARIEDMVATMELISEATVRMGSQFEGHMRETTRLATAGPDTKSAKRLIKRCADDMQAYAGILKNQTPILAANREAAFDALSNSLTLHRELGTADNSNLRALNDAIEQLRSNLAVPTESMKAFRETAASFPRMTSDLNKAKRLVVEQIDALIEEFDKTDSTATNILLSMAQML